MSDKRLGLYVVKSFTCNSFLSSAAKNRKKYRYTENSRN